VHLIAWEPKGVLKRFDGEVVVSAGADAVSTGRQRRPRGCHTGREGVLQPTVVRRHALCVGDLSRDYGHKRRDRRPARVFRDDLVRMLGGPFAQGHQAFLPA
jgi:hypothetical protein